MDDLDALIDTLLSKTLPERVGSAVGKPERKIVRDAVWGMIELLPHEALIIDTPLFQRLRGIFQTGFTYFVYPCAVHSRFEHSLGCLRLAARYLDAMESRIAVEREAGKQGPVLTPALRVTVRLAALLHDVSHCIFSHVSESVYKRDTRIHNARARILKQLPPSEKTADIGAAEVLTYCLLTSRRFSSFFEEVRKAVTEQILPCDVSPENIARLIVGVPPKEQQNYAFMAHIINGPFDVDKVDYQTRDGYFTGVALPVDEARLLASLCIVQDQQTGHHELAVDHRGIAPIEQLLFNRMLLYDSVYHHHKIRAAVQLFERYVDSPEKLSLEWLLEHDEYDFFGSRNTPPELTQLILRLRHRNLPRRAVIIHQSTINHPGDLEDDVWWEIMQKLFSARESDREYGRNWFDKVRKLIPKHLPPHMHEQFYLDVPNPPKYMKIQRGSKIAFSDGSVGTLDDVFPITTALNSYAQKCKYRVYVFADVPDHRTAIAAAAYKAFREVGMSLNEDAFRLAKLDPKDVTQAAGETIPKREKQDLLRGR